MSQLERLQAALAARPQDPFLHYAIAMELVKAGALDAALEKFSFLSTRYSSYVPTYFQLASLLAENERGAEAREVIEEGIAVAQSAGDAHAASELSAMIAQAE